MRGFIDLQGPGGVALPAIDTGHLRDITAPDDSVQRCMCPLVAKTDIP